MATKEFEYESLQDPNTIVEYLHALADGFRKGQLALSSNGTELVMTPRGTLRMAVEAKQSKHRARMTLRVSWRIDGPGERESTGPLKISAGEAQETQ